MDAHCTICDKQIVITVDEFIEDVEHICDECGAVIMENCYNYYRVCNDLNKYYEN